MGRVLKKKDWEASLEGAVDGSNGGFAFLSPYIYIGGCAGRLGQ